MALKRFLMIGGVAAVLFACGDDSSSNPVTNSGEDSSSSICKDCDDSSSSKAKSSSSSNVNASSAKQSSDSKSSSSAKSSSSEKNAASSSSTKSSSESSSSKNVEPDEQSSSSSSVDSSSSAAQSSSSIKYVEPCRTDSKNTCELGTLTDERDGQTYKTVTIGTQTWMAENLNYKTDKSFCNNELDSCEAKFGRLYFWSAAMDSAGTWSPNGKDCGNGKTCSSSYLVRGVCPKGWHLPDSTEWNNLFVAIGGKENAGKKLKSTTGWNEGNGVDAYAFSAYPTGFRRVDGKYAVEGGLVNFWLSVESNETRAWYISLDASMDKISLNNIDKDNGFAVRCVMD